MSEFDELDRLRDADPVKKGSIPSAEDSGPRALRERIMMNAPGMERGGFRRVRTLLSAAAVVALIVAGGIVLATRGTNKPAPKNGGEPITPPGQALCAESYDLNTLKNREVAFDGTVTNVSGDEVSFMVNEWFKGGSGSNITLKGASTLGGITSLGDPVPLDRQSRLLVAGDGGFAWSCGFTQPYSDTVAKQWRQALS